MSADIWVIRKIDLINFFQLTELISTYHKMGKGEAFDWIWTKILKTKQGKKIKIFDTGLQTLPRVIEEVCLEMNDADWNNSIINEIFDTNFWLEGRDFEYARSKRSRKHDCDLIDAAILKSDALELFNIPNGLLSLVDLSINNVPKQEAIHCKIEHSDNAARYSTKWLEIQQAAIAQFFNPRKNPDAKKDEVIGWINLQAVNAGLGESNNIASTIFTIIKPENHDPKKKRVEPQ